VRDAKRKDKLPTRKLRENLRRATKERVDRCKSEKRIESLLFFVQGKRLAFNLIRFLR